MREKYESWSLSSLREYAKSRGIKGLSAKKKDAVIDALCAKDAEDASQPSVPEKTEKAVEGKTEVKRHRGRPSAKKQPEEAAEREESQSAESGRREEIRQGAQELRYSAEVAEVRTGGAETTRAAEVRTGDAEASQAAEIRTDSTETANAAEARTGSAEATQAAEARTGSEEATRVAERTGSAVVSQSQNAAAGDSGITNTQQADERRGAGMKTQQEEGRMTHPGTRKSQERASGNSGNTRQDGSSGSGRPAANAGYVRKDGSTGYGRQAGSAGYTRQDGSQGRMRPDGNNGRVKPDGVQGRARTEGAYRPQGRSERMNSRTGVRRESSGPIHSPYRRENAENAAAGSQYSAARANPDFSNSGQMHPAAGDTAAQGGTPSGLAGSSQGSQTFAQRPAEQRIAGQQPSMQQAAERRMAGQQPSIQQAAGQQPEQQMAVQQGQLPQSVNTQAFAIPEGQGADARLDKFPGDLAQLDSGQQVTGILEVMQDGGFGFIRSANYMPGENDVYVSPSQIRKFGLKTGDIISGNTRVKTMQEKFSALLYLKAINGMQPSEAAKRYNFEDMTPIFPSERLRMERSAQGIAMRIVDLFSPIGKGQRGMIVSQPKAGKTTLLKDIARSILENDPTMKLIILLIDERPEEVTDIKEAIHGKNVEVIYSTFDELPEHHKRVSEMVIERAKRLVEHRENVTILLDSITRLARAYNLTIPPSGRTLSGGLDPAALHMPKRFFGAARNMREGGSLTILATALVDTGSKMDDVVYEEFKGTGNMELVLDRKLSERRVFPALDIPKSGTRREDLLLDKEEQEAVYIMRRALNGMKSEDAVENILNLFVRTRTNRELVQEVRRKKYV